MKSLESIGDRAPSIKKHPQGWFWHAHEDISGGLSLDEVVETLWHQKMLPEMGAYQVRKFVNY